MSLWADPSSGGRGGGGDETVLGKGGKIPTTAMKSKMAVAVCPCVRARVYVGGRVHAWTSGGGGGVDRSHRRLWSCGSDAGSRWSKSIRTVCKLPCACTHLDAWHVREGWGAGAEGLPHMPSLGAEASSGLCFFVKIQLLSHPHCSRHLCTPLHTPAWGPSPTRLPVPARPQSPKASAEVVAWPRAGEQWEARLRMCDRFRGV